MAPSIRHLVYFGVFFGISYLAPSKSSYIRSSSALTSVLGNGLFEDDSGETSRKEQEGIAKPSLRQWISKTGGLVFHGLSLTGGKSDENLRPPSSCKIDLRKVNLGLLEVRLQSCLANVFTPVVVALATDRPVTAVCSRTEEIRTCLEDTLEVLECLPIRPAYRNQIFRPREMFENVVAAFCAEEWSPRLTNATMYIIPGGEAFKTCEEEHAAETKEQMEFCVDNHGVKLDFDDICGVMDALEKCKLSSYKVCKDSDLITKAAEGIWDIGMGLAFKCPKHPSF